MAVILGFSFLDGNLFQFNTIQNTSQVLIALRIKQQNDSRLAGLNSLTFSVWISRGAGLVLTVDGAIILLPMCRNLLRWIRPKIKFLPLDESQWFHRQVAYSMLFWAAVHTSAHYVKYVPLKKYIECFC
jgi:NADPH oxidase 1